jgi:hypothetical protein
MQKLLIGKIKQKNLLKFTIGVWMSEKIIDKINRVVKSKGIVYLGFASVKTIIDEIKKFTGHYYYKLIKSRRQFVFGNKKLDYFYHHDGATWMTERSVEIPIIISMIGLDEMPNKNILEVGNVLSHYLPVKEMRKYLILDKFEVSKGVINEDIVAFKTDKKFDLILSISTIEHIGFDENVLDESLNEPEKIVEAIKNMKSILSPNGKIIVTIPKGYNSGLDKLISSKRIKFDELICMKRISKDNAWVETDFENIKNTEYNKPFFLANGLMIGIIKK